MGGGRGRLGREGWVGQAAGGMAKPALAAEAAAVPPGEHGCGPAAGAPPRTCRTWPAILVAGLSRKERTMATTRLATLSACVADEAAAGGGADAARCLACGVWHGTQLSSAAPRQQRSHLLGPRRQRGRVVAWPAASPRERRRRRRRLAGRRLPLPPLLLLPRALQLRPEGRAGAARKRALQAASQPAAPWQPAAGRQWRGRAEPSRPPPVLPAGGGGGSGSRWRQHR